MVMPAANGPKLRNAAKPSKAPKVRVRGYGGLWNCWLWVSWFIGPAAVLLRSMFGVTGWETLFAVLFAPVIVPALGLLGALPRVVLRRRGHRSIPVWVGVCIVTSAWGLVLLVMSMRGATDAASIDSVAAMIGGLSMRAEGTLLTAATLTWVIGYAAALVLAFVLRPPAQGSGSTSGPAEAQRFVERRARRADIAALVAAALVPTLLFGLSVAFDRTEMHGARDFGGAQEADVASLTPGEQRDRQEAQWEEAQAAIAPLRSAIAADGWRTDGGVGVDAETSGVEPLGYTISAHWRRTMPGPPEAVAEQVRGLAERRGWEQVESDRRAYSARPGEKGIFWEDEAGAVRLVQYDFEDERGYRLTVWAAVPEEADDGGSGGDSDDAGNGDAASASAGRPADETVLRLAVRSGEYWQSRGEQFDWYDVEGTGAAPPSSYAGDEWPTLLEAAAALSY